MPADVFTPKELEVLRRNKNRAGVGAKSTLHGKGDRLLGAMEGAARTSRLSHAQALEISKQLAAAPKAPTLGPSGMGGGMGAGAPLRQNTVPAPQENSPVISDSSDTVH